MKSYLSPFRFTDVTPNRYFMKMFTFVSLTFNPDSIGTRMKSAILLLMVIAILDLDSINCFNTGPKKISSMIQSKIKSYIEKSLLITSTICISKPIIANADSILPTFSSIKNNLWYNPYNQRIFDTQRGSFLPSHPERYLGDELGLRNIIVIGEIHSNPCHHRVEFEIIKTLASLPASSNKKIDPIYISLSDTTNSNNINIPAITRSVVNSNLAIGMEAFYRQHQSALDDFIFSHKNFELLQNQTDWKSTWGYDLNYYSKILRYASENNIRLIGLNVPQPVVHYVSKMGLQSVPEAIKKYLPSVDTLDLAHRQQFDGEMEAAGMPSHMLKGVALQRMYEAQCLWDDYMAESASLYLQSEQPAKRLVIIAGSGHVLGRYGIPNRLLKRLPIGQSDPFVVVPQQVDWLSNGLPDIDLPLSKTDCDWAWYTEKEIV